MVSFNLSLSPELQQFLQDELELGKFNGPHEYFAALLARAKASKERLETLLIQGLESGEPEPLDAGTWSEIRQAVASRLAK